MQIQPSEPRRILVTGGTSGLGMEIVKIFLAKGWQVTATGRNQVSFPQYAGQFSFVKADFSNLADVAQLGNQIACDSNGFDLVINNAGVLGFPGCVTTIDGLEYTFQVNFLAHLLLNEIIIRNKKDPRPLKIIPVVSPVYRCCLPKYIQPLTGYRYGSFRSYTFSKFYLALMCSYLPSRYPGIDVSVSGFNPGIFRSGIY
ncbi:MAG: SDR family NAD(P)-dependent oxidoreductase, partial [Bacteroidales bacterium]